jgi:sporulation protein YlmC with PRC-barrel domain
MGSDSNHNQALIDANAIIGAPVRSQGKDVGKVSGLMVDPKDGRVVNVIVGIGGLLGVGEKNVSMPWNSVKLAQDGGKIVIDASQMPIEQSPSASPRSEDKNSDKSKK